MKTLTLPAARGWDWLTDGFRISRSNHVMLRFLIASYWMLIDLVSIIPWGIGTIASTLCFPAFAVSLMNACRNIEAGTPLAPQLLFSGFQRNLRSLLTLGAIYLVARVGVLALSPLADDGALLRMVLARYQEPNEAAVMDDMLVGLNPILLLQVPAMIGCWYASVLAAWHGVSPGKALFFSFVTCARNWRAFLVWSLGVALVGAVGLFVAAILSLPNTWPNWVTVLLLTFSVYWVVKLTAPPPFYAIFRVYFVAFLFVITANALLAKSAPVNDLLLTLVVVLLFLVAAPTVVASFYVSYRDVFVADEHDA